MFMKHLLAIDNDVINQRSLEHAIYVMRDVLQLPEAIIAQAASINYDNALYYALLFFCYTDTCFDQIMENPQISYGIIRQGVFTNVDDYRYYFDHYGFRDDDCVKKEFSAYTKIYDLISDYVLNFAYYEDGKIKIYEYWR